MEKTGLPVNQDVLLEAGVHIGTRIKTNDMRAFIFKKRDDGLYILDLRKTAERLMTAAKLLAKYPSEDVLIVASRIYSSNPALKFSKLTGIPLLQGRFVPGTMVNLMSKRFREPKIIFVCDPKGERQAIVEGAKNGVPIVALCDTDNETKFVDLIVPINNKGRRSLALVFYILARELMLSQGKIKSYSEFEYDVDYFERLEEEKEETGKVTVRKIEETGESGLFDEAVPPSGEEEKRVTVEKKEEREGAGKAGETEKKEGAEKKKEEKKKEEEKTEKKMEEIKNTEAKAKEPQKKKTRKREEKKSEKETVKETT
ncbi:MAG: 30S ribosomal protein S2 [Candidatus Bilamarchaeaceae archaeon]